MNWSDVGNLVGRAAPVVGTLLGGPAGAVVGEMVATALGTKNDPDAVSAALSANPEALARVQELQINAQVELQRIDAQAKLNQMQADGAQYAAEAADRDSARKLAAQQPHDFVRPTLTFMMLGGSLFIVVSVLIGWATDVIKDPTAALTVGTVLGLWLGMTKEVMGFWFGMTKESQKQSAAITDFATAAGTVSKPDKL
jgi:hypothetical protein